MKPFPVFLLIVLSVILLSCVGVFDVQNIEITERAQFRNSPTLLGVQGKIKNPNKTKLNNIGLKLQLMKSGAVESPLETLQTKNCSVKKTELEPAEETAFVCLFDDLPQAANYWIKAFSNDSRLQITDDKIFVIEK